MKKLAIVYDFDGTLSPKNMQEFEFLPKIGLKAKDFWQAVLDESKRTNGDNILIYMSLMLEKAREKKIPIRRADFKRLGKTVELFPGVLTWFDHINEYATLNKIKIEHFILSSGLREIIEGTPIAKNFNRIYASGFWYDENGVARGPATALNYTTKTQYLFRINKGSLDIWEHEVINSFVPHQDRHIPFSNIIFIGDGETDIPCFRLVKDQGGHSIAVYAPNKKGSKAKSQKLIADGRVNAAKSADYTSDSSLADYVRAIIKKISLE